MWILPALWQTVTKIDKSKVNVVIATRNSLGVALPLGIGIALGNPLAAVAIASGALNVAYSDGTDPYPLRARRMLMWTLLGGIAVFTGSVTGRYSWLAVIIATVWAFLAGLAVAVSTRAGDLGLNTLVSVIIFAARGARPPWGAFEAALLVVLGGVIQMALALLFWPLRRYEPERMAVASAYCTLANELDPEHPAQLDAPLTTPSQEVQDVVASLGRDNSVEGYRLRMLFDQVDRLRLSNFVLERFRSQLLHEKRKENPVAASLAEGVDRILHLSSSLIASIGEHLHSNRDLADVADMLDQLQTAVDAVHVPDGDATFPIAREVAAAVDVLAGQLRVVATLASHATTSGAIEYAHQESRHPWRLQTLSWIGTIRANLDLRSTYFRHALRLAICVCAGDMISRYVAWQRTYWLPMTIAVVLKPDFTTTISRGILRLAGTFGGLILATILYHAFPPSALTQLLLVGIFTYLLRSIGPANYGVFSVAISGLIVFLIAETGVPPAQVVSERALNTAAGGCFALAAYALWPTWERTQINEVLAQLLDAAREYFHRVVQSFGDGDLSTTALDQLRATWRRLRSDAEGSVNRIAAEPGVSRETLSCLTSFLATSQIVVRSIMSMESAVLEGKTDTPKEPFRKFATDIEFTLYFLAATLRGSTGAGETLPKLREDHRRIVESRNKFSANDEFLVITADQLTVALNTLREQVIRYRNPQL